MPTSKEYREAHREQIKAYQHQYYETHKAERTAYKKAYYEANKERCQERTRRWEKENPDKVRESQRKYYHRKKTKKEAEVSQKATANTILIDNNLEQMLISAERYACGRRTYIVADTVHYIRGLIPFLSDWCLTVMRQDLRSEFDRCQRMQTKLGMTMDHEKWIDFLNALEEELKRRSEHENQT